MFCTGIILNIRDCEDGLGQGISFSTMTLCYGSSPADMSASSAQWRRFEPLPSILPDSDLISVFEAEPNSHPLLT